MELFKIVKVHSRMKLHDYGFVTALRFRNYTKEVSEFEAKLRNTYGAESWSRDEGFWKSHWSKGSYTSTPDGYSQEWNRPYFIGFRNHADISAALLML
jgi:hypothetical protein